jgi:hypothetical protein
MVKMINQIEKGDQSKDIGLLDILSEAEKIALTFAPKSGKPVKLLGKEAKG